MIEVLHDEADSRLPEAARVMLREVAETIADLEARLARIDRTIVTQVKNNETTRRLMSIPGVGPITASAVVAMVGDPARFRSGRHFAAWLGLVAKQNSTGGKTRLGRISKMGDRYLRKLLVLGATSGLWQARHTNTPLTAWTRRLLERKPARLVTVALANKMARIIWAVMAHGDAYRPEAAAV